MLKDTWAGTAMTPLAMRDDDFAGITGNRARLVAAGLLAILAANAVSVITMLFWL